MKTEPSKEDRADSEAIQNASDENDRKKVELNALRIIEAEMESGIRASVRPRTVSSRARSGGRAER